MPGPYWTMTRSWLPIRSHDASDLHSAFMANRTDFDGFSGERLVAGFPVEELGVGFRRGSVQELAAQRQSPATMTIGEESEVADLGKALGKNVHKEAADELVGFESHGSNAIVFFAVLPLEGNLAVLKRHQAVIGNGDTVGVAAEVVEDLNRSTKGRFGVDDPFVLAVSA